MKRNISALSFKPKQASKRLLGILPQRVREVLIARYGLGESEARQTLEEIGKKYGITRERVRQIENYGLVSIRKSERFSEEQKTFSELGALITSMGGLVA